MRTLHAVFKALTLFLLFCPVLLYAQGSADSKAAPAPTVSPAVKPDAAGDPFATEPYVVERLDVVIVRNADGTGYTERTIAVKIQSETALHEFGVAAMEFASASEHVDIHYARAHHPDGSVTETPVSDVEEQPEQITVQAPFYSDLKEAQLPIKNLQVGDTLEWQVRVVRTKPETPNQFWGQESFIPEGALVRAESIELRVPESSAVNVWTNPKLDLKPAESVAGGQHIYHWDHSSLKPTVGPAADQERAAKKKTLWTADQELDAEQGKLPSIAWSTFKSWAAVGEWYRGLEADRIIPDQSVKDKVAELTAGKQTDEDKVRAVYAYVSTRVRYIGVAFGVGRYQPHHADEVLENQYGDCKDKHTLLASMLTVLGLHPDAVAIGADIRFNEAVPSPGSFNHVITHVMVNGQPVWLDATAEVAPYRVLTKTIRDKQALVIPETGIAQIEKTPADLPFPAVLTWKSTGTLDKNGVSESHITMTFRGDDELLFRQIFRQVPLSQLDQSIQKFASSMGYSGTISHPDISNVENTTDPFTISFDYHREQAGDWDHHKTLAQFAPKWMPVLNEKDPPVQTIILGIPRTQESHAEMKLPEGWSATPPDDVHEKTAFATYDETYHVDKGILYADEKIVVLQEKLPVSDWKEYQKWQTASNLDSDLYIQLLAPGEKSSTDSKSDEAAANLIQGAVEAISRNDLSTASKLLDDAKKINDKQWSLWAAYGELASVHGDTNKAIEMCQKEISIHPDNYWAYDNLARMQEKKGQHDDSIETLHKWASLDTATTDPEIQYVNALVNNGSAEQAVKEAKAGLQRLPDDKRQTDQLNWSLGWAELKAGMTDEAVATFKSIMTAAPDVHNQTNNMAYEFAQAGKGLDFAETSERGVLDKLAAENPEWTLKGKMQSIKNTSMLIASWDTMGWIYYKEKEYDKARTFLEAAWHARPEDATMAGHLGDVWMALNDPNKAYDMYELALLAHGGSDMKAKLEAAKVAGGRSSLKDKDKALLNLRTITVESWHGVSVSAEYRLLVSRDKVEKVEPTGGRAVLGGADMIRKMTFPQFFPEPSTAKLLFTAVLNCHEQVCELVMEP